jgi:hypothetical protein
MIKLVLKCIDSSDYFWFNSNEKDAIVFIVKHRPLIVNVTSTDGQVFRLESIEIDDDTRDNDDEHDNLDPKSMAEYHRSKIVVAQFERDFIGNIFEMVEQWTCPNEHMFFLVKSMTTTK